MSEYVMIMVTCSSLEEARLLAVSLLERKLAACANIKGGVESHYWWEGRLESAEEALIIFKTRKELLGNFTEAVKSLHSYSVPEVIAFSIIGGNPGYFNWIEDSTA